MKNYLFVIVVFGLVGCGITKTSVVDTKVEHKGALKNMMHLGDLSAKADLSDYRKVANLYALGAIEGLKGEVLIMDSKPNNTFVSKGEIVFDRSFSKKACLLVTASVKKWKTIEIPNHVSTYAQLEGFVAKSAQEAGININEPFPFLLEGKMKSFDWHVINWKDGDTEHSHEKHIQSGLFGEIKNRDVDMLGFYSDSHHAIFTHHTTNMHIHVKTKDDEIAGHVDDLVLGDDVVLKLPK